MTVMPRSGSRSDRSYIDRYMRHHLVFCIRFYIDRYMNFLYWPIYEVFESKTMRKWSKNSDLNENKNLHISVKKWKFSTYIGRKMIFEKFHISVNIWWHISVNILNFNIDRYMFTYSENMKTIFKWKWNSVPNLW